MSPGADLTRVLRVTSAIFAVSSFLQNYPRAWSEATLRILRPLSNQAGMDTEALGDSAQSSMPCPQKRGRADQDGGYEMRVYDSDAEAVQASGLDQRPNFVQLSRSHLWQEIE